MDKKVAILISTYNGEKYLKEQLDSVLEQTYNNLVVIIRDDGSNDNTKNVLQQYTSNEKIKVIEGNNIGFINSFFKLLNNAPEADYYAFCDQDDIWRKDKIERAVNKLNSENNKEPLLYASNYVICNENAKVIKKHKAPKNISFANALVECIAPGMSMVINQKAKELILSKDWTQCFYHDWWMYLICVSMGKVIYDDYESVYYRRHEETLTNRSYNPLKTLLWRFKQIKNEGYFKKTKHQIKQFYEQYEKDLPENYKNIIKPFITNYSFLNVLKKTTYLKPYRNGLIDEILLRILFIINVI